MAVAVDTHGPLLGLQFQPFLASLESLRKAEDEFEEFVEQRVEAFEVVRTRLLARAATVEAERHELMRLRQELLDAEIALEQAEADYADRHARLNAEFQRRLEEWQQTKAALEAELAQSREQSTATNALAEQFVALESVHEQTVGQLAATETKLQEQERRFVEQQTTLTQAAADMERLREELTQSRNATIARERELREQLASGEAALAAERRDLSALSEELTKARDEGRTRNDESHRLREEAADLRARLTRSSEESASWREELGEVQTALAELRIQFVASRSELDQAHVERRKVQAELDKARLGIARREESGSTRGQPDGEVSARLVALDAENSALKVELAEARKLWARHADVATELAHDKEELARAEAALAQAHAELDRLHAGDPALSLAEESLKERLGELEQERQEMESELELVRKRAMALAEAAAEERRLAAEERAAWTGEIKQLRRQLDTPARADEHRNVPAAPRAEDRPAPHPSAPAVNGQTSPTTPSGSSGLKDPVVDSIVAQFEMLQRDVQRRRSKSKAK